MVHAATLFDVLPPVLTISEHPLTFEELDHNYGFMLYTTNLTSAKISKLSARVYDRAHVFVDKVGLRKCGLNILDNNSTFRHFKAS